MSDVDEFDLVMPFVMCRSNGGPHDDASFVSGYRLGGIGMVLKTASALPEIQPEPVIAPLNERPQIDLLAMRFGFTLDVELLDDTEYAEYKFERAETP